MVRIDIEIRWANTMEGVPDFFETTKRDAIDHIVLDALESCQEIHPELIGERFSYTPDKSWKKLPKKAYFFKEDPSHHRYMLCFLTKRPINFPEGEYHSVYVVYPELSEEEGNTLVITYGCD